MMGDTAHLLFGNLTCADIETLVYLTGISRNNLAIEFFCKAHSQVALARSCGAEDDDDV